MTFLTTVSYVSVGQQFKLGGDWLYQRCTISYHAMAQIGTQGKKNRRKLAKPIMGKCRCVYGQGGQARPGQGVGGWTGITQ